MYFSSWVPRFTRNRSKTQTLNPSQRNNLLQEDDEQVYGVTENLVIYLKSFTLDTFTDFSLHEVGADNETTTGVDNGDETGTSSSANVRRDLTEWEEKHAMLVLSKSKELSQLRFKLCPGRLKEQQFWRIYFKLTHHLVAEYKLHAIERAKMGRSAKEKSNDSKNVVYEVEMAETKQHATP